MKMISSIARNEVLVKINAYKTNQAEDSSSNLLSAACLSFAALEVPSQTPLCTLLSLSQNWTGDESSFAVKASTPSFVMSNVCSNWADRPPSLQVTEKKEVNSQKV